MPSFKSARQHRTANLRQSRISVPGGVYFVTFCTKARTLSLASQQAQALGHLACRRIIGDGDVSWLTATLMPDHVHLLFQLGIRLPLDCVIAKWRTLAKTRMPSLKWHANYFEHQLRPAEKMESYAWYMFMNPYRAGLIETDQVWPGWWTDGTIAREFIANARPGPTPWPEWLDRFDDVARSLSTGETETEW